MIQIISKVINKFNVTKVLLACSLLLVFFVSLWGIQNNKSIGIWGDEFGYWQGAAFFLNKDWSSIASTHGYYGYGFGIILTPIMFLFSFDSVVMYQATLILEAILLTSCVIMAYKCLCQLQLCKNNIVRILISTMSILYPSNILWVKTTLAEILLVFLGWSIFYLMTCFHIKKKKSQAIGLILLSVYAYTVHQRALVILIAILLVISLEYGKKIISREYFFIIVVLILTFAFTLFIKYLYEKDMYSFADTALLDANNLNGIGSRLIAIISSWKGISLFIISLMGKFYYIAVASYLFVFYGISKCINELILTLRNKSSIKYITPYLYILLSFLFAMGLGAIAMPAGFENRTDILIYGRYAEYTVGPLILVGLAFAFEKPKKILKSVIISIIIAGFLTLLVQKNIPLEATNANTWVNCTGISDLIYQKEYGVDNAVVLAFMRSLLISLVLLFLLNIKKNTARKLANIWLICIICMWIHTASYTWSNVGSEWRENLYIQQKKVVSNIPSENIYIYQCTYGGFFQFLEPNSRVTNVLKLEDIMFEENKNIAYVITDRNTRDAEYIRNNYQVVDENERYFSWKYIED